MFFAAIGLSRDIEEEFESHLAEPVARGRDPRRRGEPSGPVLQHREESRDQRLIPWLDAVRADTVFGLRQLMKRKVTSAAAILSLGLAIGSCTAAFRLIDALLWRPLPVAHPEQLFGLARLYQGPNGTSGVGEAFAYPDFALMSEAVKGQAELIAVSFVERADLTYMSDQEMEKAHVQYITGNLFPSFGLRPSVGRLLRADDNLKPGAHPVAVLSQDYWTRRFGRDPDVVGRNFHLGSAKLFATGEAGNTLYQIVGVVDGPFTGTETGQVTDVFLPAMMHPAVTKDDWTWIRALARLTPGVGVEPVRARLDATSYGFEEARSKGFQGMSETDRKQFLAQTVLMTPAAGGMSDLQNHYRRALTASGGVGCAGAADCVCERGEFEDCAVGRARAGDGAARLHRRWPGATRAIGAGGKRVAGPFFGCDGRAIRVAVRRRSWST